MAGLGKYDRTPRENVRDRRNSQRMSGAFDISFLGDGLGLVDGKMAVVLATDPGLQFVSGGLSALVQGVLAIDASGIKLTFGTGLRNDGGTLKTKDPEIDHDDLLNWVEHEHVDWVNGSGDGITHAHESLYLNVDTTATALQLKDVTFLGTDSITSGNLFVGRATGDGLTDGTHNTIVGCYAGDILTGGDDNVIVGYDAGDTLTTGQYNTLIGAISDVNAGDVNSSIAIGYAATPVGSNQCVIGGHFNSTITDVYIGNGVNNTSATSVTIHATGGEGIDDAGGTLYLAGGRSTGDATPGSVIIQTSIPSAVSTDTLRELATRVVVDADGITVLGTTITGFATNLVQIGDLALGGGSRVYANSGDAADILFLDAKGTGAIALNYNTGSGVVFYDGAQGAVGSVGASGLASFQSLSINANAFAVASDGETFWTGASSGLPYGSMYIHDGNQNVDISGAGADTDVKITGFTTGPTQSIQFGGDALHIDIDGHHLVTWSCSFSMDSGVNEEYHFHLFKEGNHVASGAAHAFLSAAGASLTLNIGGTAVLDCAHNDSIDLRVRNIGDNNDITVHDCNMTIVHIGGT